MSAAVFHAESTSTRTSGSAATTFSQPDRRPRVVHVGEHVGQPGRVQDHLRRADARADVRRVGARRPPQRGRRLGGRLDGDERRLLSSTTASAAVGDAEDDADLADLVEHVVERQRVRLVARLLARGRGDVGADPERARARPARRRRRPRSSTPSRRRRSRARARAAPPGPGTLSARATGTSAAAAAHSSGTGPSANAVPTSRSASPRASIISVVDDLMVTTRCGGARRPCTVVPQLSRVTGANAADDEAVGARRDAAGGRRDEHAVRPSVGAGRQRPGRCGTWACGGSGRWVAWLVLGEHERSRAGATRATGGRPKAGRRFPGHVRPGS